MHDARWFSHAALYSSLGLLLLFVASQCPAQAQSQGQWSALQTWPTRAVHTTLLPDGRVFFISYYSESLQPNIWDPATNTFTATVPAPYAFFCSGHTALADGRIFIAGGHIADYTGYSHAQIYDPFKNTLTAVPDMNAGRWYPTVTPLANGDVLVTSGDIDPQITTNVTPQVFQFSTGTWRDLTTAQLDTPLYPIMVLAPNGKVVNPGPGQTTRYLDTSGTGQWTPFATMNLNADRDYGPVVMYDVGKLLAVGGADPATATAEIIDLTAATPVWKFTGNMNYARRQHNAVIMPDGKVFIVGGSNGSGFDNSDSPVLPTEMWDPATGQFTIMSGIAVYRGYHSTAILLPDGTVLSAGGNIGGPSAQIFQPPYLFAGARPSISSAPTSVAYGQTIFVGTPDSAAITQVTWLRTASTTHTLDQSQRFMRLSFTKATGGLNVTMPADANVSPPGYYMLFILNGSGVPSVAKIIQIIQGGGATTGIIGGTVTNTSGAALAGVAITSGNSTATTAPNGAYTLTNVNAGPATVSAALSGYKGASENLTVNAGANNQAAPLQLAPVNPGTVTGKVTDNGSNSISGAQISGAGLNVVTDGTGSYTMNNVPAGSVTLVASAAGFKPASETMTVTAGTTTRAATMALPPNSGDVTGKVTDSSGAPIVGATVSFGGGSKTTDASGNYSFQALPAGAIQLVASASGFQSVTQNVTVNPGQITTANFTLPPANTSPGTVTGQVTNISTGQPISAATVQWNSVSVAVNSSGVYTINNVSGGSQSLTASATGYLPVTNTTTVAGGTTTLNFQLSTAGQLTVQVVTTTGSPVNAASVTIQGGVIATTVNGTTNASGLFSSNWIPIGNYTVSASAGNSSGSTTATVNTGQTTTVTVTLNGGGSTTGTISGTVTDTSGAALSGASVSTGIITATTAANGTYILSNVSAGNAGVTASMSGYQSATQNVNVTAGATSTANFSLAKVTSSRAMALTSLTFSDGSPHTFYVGTDQHIHHLSWSSTSGWQGEDITAIAGNTLAASGSALTSAVQGDSNTPHVFYLAGNQHVNDLSFNGSTWSNQDLTALAGSTPAAAASGLTSLGTVADGVLHVFYVGTDQHVYRLFLGTSGSLQNQDVTAQAGVTEGQIVLAGSGSALTSVIQSSNSMPHIFYLDANQHVNHMWLSGSTWGNQDIAAISGNISATAGSGLTSLGTVADGLLHVFYVAANQHVNRLFWSTSGGLQNQDVTAQAAITEGQTVLAASGSALTSVIQSSNNMPHIFYLDASQHVDHMWISGSTWGNQDISALTGNTAAAAGSGLSSLGTVGDGLLHAFYSGADQHVYRLFWSTSAGLQNQDLTPATATPAVRSASTTTTTGGKITVK